MFKLQKIVIMAASKLLLLASTLLAAHALPDVQRRQAPSGVPDYALTYAPIVYLYSTDQYRPSDLQAQLDNTTPQINSTDISGAPSPLNLDNLSSLNQFANANNTVYLTSNVPPYDNPSYFLGVAPDSTGKTDGAVSAAIIVNDHGSGLVDVFYMYFYAFNYGGSYFDMVVGNHVGDWEHNMVRFQDGTPQAVWYSQHSNGEAFTYDAVDKYNNGTRPVAFSANGTHANYATNGTHDHVIPNVNLPDGPINDYADFGPVWDPTLSAYYYNYDADTQTFVAFDNSTPVDWLYFTGAWGDAMLSKNNSNQFCLFDITALCKYSGGPTGPEDKQLNRTQVCPDNGNDCIVRPVLGP